MGWLATRDSLLDSVFRPSHPVGFNWLVGFHLVLAIVSFVLVSPFLAGIAFFVASTAAVTAVGDHSLHGRKVPVWALPALSLFFIPPPMMLDQDLHQILAGFAARLSQGWLDAMQVLNVVQGSIVVTPEKRFFVDDACSGTHSLFVAVCVALILCIFKQRSRVHVFVILLTAGLISVASNVLRICLVIGALHFWGLELDQGWIHSVLGVAFFALDLALVASADHGWHFLLNHVPEPASVEFQAPVSSAGPAVGWQISASVLVSCVGLVLLLGPEVMVRLLPASRFSHEVAGTGINAFQMPGQLAGWERQGEKPIEDSIIGKLGVRNQVWLYRKDGLEAFVAVNFPFLGFHDTRICYNGQGWQFQKQVDGAMPGDSAKNTVRFLDMIQPTEMMRARLWLSVLDDRGIAQEFISENPMDRISSRIWSRWTQPPERGITYVLQVMALETQGDGLVQNAFTDLLAMARDHLALALSNPAALKGKESQ